MLDRDQAAMAAALLEGPSRLPPELFAGEWSAVLRGMKVHANTISHARLIALEETFPHTRTFLGEEEFNRLSRDFVGEGGAQGRSLNHVGTDFPAFLDRQCAALAVDIARVEWLWLDSYHAAEAAALTLADLAGHDEAALLALVVTAHPAAMAIVIDGAAAPYIDPVLPVDCSALLITRPDADVRLFPATAVEVEALARAGEKIPLGNLLGLFAEQHGDGVEAFMPFLAAGTLQRADR